MATLQNFDIINSIISKQNIYKNFRDRLEKTFNTYKDSVDVSKFTSSSNQNNQKYKVMYDYLFPLCYLIYGYIYQEYNKKQVERHLFMKNEKTYDMYLYFFDKYNPIIKKVNLYYYNRFLKDKERINKGEETGIFLQNDIIEEKKKVNDFFNNFLKNFIKSDDNINTQYNLSQALQNEYNDLLYKNFDSCLAQILLINKKLENIMGKYKSSSTPINFIKLSKNLRNSGNIDKGTPDLTQSDIDLINNIKNKLDGILVIDSSTSYNGTKNLKDLLSTSPITPNSENIIDLLDYLAKQDYKIFKIYEKEYNILFNLINTSMLTNIKNINNFIILLSNVQINTTFLNPNNINLDNIYKNYNEIKTFSDKINDNKNRQNEIINKINQLSKNINLEIDLYNDFFKTYYDSSLNKKLKNNQMNKFIVEINKQYSDNLNNIYDLLNLLSGSTTKTQPSFYTTKSSNTTYNSGKNNKTIQFKQNIKNLEDIDDINNSYYLIQLLLIAYSIYERFEDSYFVNLANVKGITELNSSKDIDYKTINNLLNTFTMRFRDYIKQKSSINDKKVDGLNEIDENLSKYLSDIKNELTIIKTNNSNVKAKKNEDDLNKKKKELQDKLNILVSNSSSSPIPDNILNSSKLFSIKKFDNKFYEPYNTFYNNFTNDIKLNLNNIITKLSSSSSLSSLSSLSSSITPLDDLKREYSTIISGGNSTKINSFNNIILDTINFNLKKQYNDYKKIFSNTNNIFENIEIIKNKLDDIKSRLENQKTDLENEIAKIQYSLDKITKIVSYKDSKNKMYEKMNNGLTSNLNILNGRKSEIKNGLELLITPQNIISIKESNTFSLNSLKKISPGETINLLTPIINNKKNSSGKPVNSKNSNIKNSNNKKEKYTYYTSNEIKDNFIGLFQVLSNTSKLLYDGTNKIKEGNSSNKLSFLYSLKNKKLNDILKQINELTNNILTSTSKPITVDDLKKNMNDIIKNMNDNFKTNSNDFIKILNTLPTNKNSSINKNVSNEVQPFFKIYNNYNNKLIKQIKVLLNKINNGDYELRDNIIPGTPGTSSTLSPEAQNIFTIFQKNIIGKKYNKYNEIEKNSENKNLKNEKKGNITYILAYTDILLQYFIELLIFIDYLSYFYKAI